MADAKPTIGFHDRYANDPEFKRQVDDGRKRAEASRNIRALKDALAMSRGAPGSKAKHY